MAQSKESIFFEKIETLKSIKNANCYKYTREKINHIIDRLQNFSEVEKKTDNNYNYRKAFDIFECNEVTILRKKGTTQQIVAMEDVFQVLTSAHKFTGHGGRDVMHKHISAIYANITREEILLFVKECEECQLKRGRVKKSIVVKPILSKELNSRCHVDLIDFQSQPDEPFKYILNYQDHLTKFVRLRALKTRTAEETAKNVVEIFCELEAPHILQSDNGGEFANKVVNEVVKMWPEGKVVHGKPRHSQSQGSVERTNKDVQDKLACWLREHKTSEWASALKYIQFQKNVCFHRGIGRTPYEAHFGVKPKLGITSLNLPSTHNIETEEDLAAVLRVEREIRPSSVEISPGGTSADQQQYY